MPHHLPLKAALKRGALIAAANWPLVVVQFIAEATLKILLAVPVIGGLFLVVLLLGAEVDDLLAGDVRDIVASVFAALRANPVAFAAYATAFLLVLLGGSALTFIVKGGTMALLADAEATAGPIERPPLRIEAVRRAGRVHIDPFLDGCKRLWRRYLRLGGCLLIAYLSPPRSTWCSSSAATRWPRTHRYPRLDGPCGRWPRASSWCGSR